MKSEIFEKKKNHWNRFWTADESANCQNHESQKEKTQIKFKFQKTETEQ